MADDVRPIIIKRKKVIAGGHHGGAWKVAYADFVTAMMAFFLLMWLLNATTEDQRKGLADYFNPSIPVHRTSGGGDGPFGGPSQKSEETLAQNGSGATKERPSAQSLAKGETGSDSADVPEEAFIEIQAALKALGGESALADEILKHVRTRVTDEGLVIEIFDIEGSPLFEAETDAETAVMRTLMILIGDVVNLVENRISVAGHITSVPLSGPEFKGWDISTRRALLSRGLLGRAGVAQTRFARVAGMADRDLQQEDPFDVRNNRIEITVLRSGSEAEG
ncbi:flagellar motor protein MotB [Algicella marina]|uniref:Chemotaxis protein MotB n=1 Tax=Algicella marina TaxID=2683284 RepID=A0A6P1T4E0_9RHOB|nr:flagellar motor protein MotB [Algicella marina]QHQ36366.1 chemotaxis protein MotB [Algicella marina]